jgi:hypothetical protein
MMRRFNLTMAAMAVAGVLWLPVAAQGALVTIDEIVFENGGVNSAVFAGTANFILSASTLTIVLTNTSTGVTGGAASTNLLTGIGFNTPTGVTIANNAAVNTVVASPGSTVFGGVLTDAEWGFDNSPTALNNQTQGGDTNRAVSTLQALLGFDFNGEAPGGPPPHANLNGPSFGMVSGAVPSGTCGGQACIQDSVTITIALNGTVPNDLVSQIDAGWVVLLFGSPNSSRTTQVPEPATLLLLGSGLVGVGLASRLLGKRR